jgi:hypothetical protein
METWISRGMVLPELTAVTNVGKLFNKELRESSICPEPIAWQLALLFAPSPSFVSNTETIRYVSPVVVVSHENPRGICPLALTTGSPLKRCSVTMHCRILLILEYWKTPSTPSINPPAASISISSFRNPQEESVTERSKYEGESMRHGTFAGFSSLLPNLCHCSHRWLLDRAC